MRQLKYHRQYPPGIKAGSYVSAFYEDCAESGKDLTEGGAKYNGTGPQASGMATCADSLATIKRLVFDEKRCDGAEALQAVKDNWKGHEEAVCPCKQQ